MSLHTASRDGAAATVAVIEGERSLCQIASADERLEKLRSRFNAHAQRLTGTGNGTAEGGLDSKGPQPIGFLPTLALQLNKVHATLAQLESIADQLESAV